MTDETRQAIALLRHQIISPVLMKSDRTQAAYFREQAKQDIDVPGLGRRKFSVWTMRGWLKRYRKNGFKGLLPKVRCDRGQMRKLSKENEVGILAMRRDLMDMKVAPFYRRLEKAGLLGRPPMGQHTLRRFLQERQMIVVPDPKVPRRKYEMSHFGELWVGDFMHGPELNSGIRGGREMKKKAILLAIIDDYSRLIVGYRFSFVETTGAIEQVFKEAVLTYGKPYRLYVDNGPSFSSSYLRLVCAHLEIGLIHSKPYDSPSRGKIERFFRTVRESFLIDHKATTLSEINEHFGTWLREEYHHRRHHGIDCYPIERYRGSIHDYPRARVNEDVLEEFFMARVVRKVKKDATLSFGKLIYETPAKCIGQKVDLRYRQDRPREIFLYENDKCVTQLKVVDARANGKLYKPRSRDTVIPYQEVKK